VRRGVAAFGYAVTAPDIESTDQIVDGSIAIAFNLMRQLCGPAWRPTMVRLTREAPRDKAPFARFFEAPVEFGAKAACLVFDACVLDRTVLDRDPHAADILAPLLREATATAQSDFVSTVRSTIRTRLSAGTLSRDSVARALSLSVRTLVHRLEARSLTYSGLAEEAKYEVAQDLLRKGETIAEIAARLGFADPSAFTRAFKAWSGATPARWRATRGA
jgi:AraC-like DNA-binding protein